MENINKFDDREFHEVCYKHGKVKGEPFVREVVISYSKDSFFNRMKNLIKKGRRGEVVFCIIRPNNRIITTTCREYPEGIFRIPTGGIENNENIIKAVFREIKEELGLDTEIMSFAGVLKIKFKHSQESIMFYSYIFIMNEIGGKLLEDAIDDEISEVKEVDKEGLQEVVDSLENIDEKWKDWGKFRYESTRAVLEFLKGIDFFNKKNL